MTDKPQDRSDIRAENNSIAFRDLKIEGSVHDLHIGNVVNAPPEMPRFLHHLPPPPADYTGRTTLIDQLLEDFNTHKGATITGLTGMGGIGKTALGLVVANKVAEQYPDAQIFLDLKGTTTPLSAMETMRLVILSFEPTADLKALDETGMADAYRSVLHGRKVLLFFDNARSAEQIVPLRPPDACSLLFTSRWTFPVAGMQSHRVDLMSKDDSVRLLTELCSRIGSQAADLAKACAYLPLAMRIAGSFLQINEEWNVEKYIAQLGDRKKRLQTLHRSREDAELTTEPDMLATFELSYARLAKEDQKCWRALGVFPGSFDKDAAQSIWGWEEGETLSLLGLLRRYSLLEYDASSSRYSLHDLLADYACSQMEKEEEITARMSHASYYKGVLATANRLYSEGHENTLFGLRLFDLEWENIRAGQAWVATTKEQNEALTKLCVEYPHAGVNILSLRQHPKERICWLNTALSSSREIGDRRGEGNALGNLGNAYLKLGEIRKAIEFHEQRLVLSRDLGDQRGEAITLGNLGNAFLDLGETRKAIEFYEQDLAIAREIKDRHGEGYALGGLGAAFAALDEIRKAIGFFEQFLAIAREIGDKWGEGYSLSRLGAAYADLGETYKAIEFYEPALKIDCDLGDRRGEGADLCSLGDVYWALGEARKAIEFHEKGLAIAREYEDSWGEKHALGGLGRCYYQLGESYKAIEFYQQELAIARKIGDRHGEGTTHGNLGLAYAALGETGKAIEFYEKHSKIAQKINDLRGEGNASFNMGRALYVLEEKDRAVDLVIQALIIYERIVSPYAEKARSTLKEWGILPKDEEGNLDDAYQALSGTRKAIEFYERSLIIKKEIGDRQGVRTALNNLAKAYYSLGEISKAIEFYEQSLEIAQAIGNRQDEGIALGNLGLAYADLGETHKAIEFYEQCLEIVREVGDQQNEGNALGNLGIAYGDLGETHKAIEFYELQLVIARKIGDQQGEGNALLNMALALYKLEQKDPAIDTVKQALAIYVAVRSPYAEQARNTLIEWGVLSKDGEGSQSE
jgi:tetratricopeptide (TPR) repeat protein